MTNRKENAQRELGDKDFTHPNNTTLLAKYLALIYATTDPELSAGDLAVYAQLADYFNPAKGYAYPSMDTMAFNTKRSKRAVVNSVSKLTEMGYVTILRQGNRTTSTRYQPIFHQYVRPIKPDSTMVNSTSLYMVKSGAQRGELGFTELVNSTSPEPTYEPEQKARVNSGGVAIAPPAAALAAPEGLPACGDPSRYAAFWAVYPLRRNVLDTEQALDAAIADGVMLDDVIAGARAYAAYIEATRRNWKSGRDYTTQPQNFILKRRWLDDWEVKPKAATTSTSTSSSKAGESKKTGRRRKNPEWIKARAASDECWSATHNASERLIAHAGYKGKPQGKCQQCYAALWGDDDTASCCDVGKPLLDKMRTTNKAWRAAEDNMPPVYLDD